MIVLRPIFAALKIVSAIFFIAFEKERSIFSFNSLERSFVFIIGGKKEGLTLHASADIAAALGKLDTLLFMITKSLRLPIANLLKFLPCFM